MSKFTITSIVVGQRHRKDLGDIDGLAASMGELGLLHCKGRQVDGSVGDRRVNVHALAGKSDNLSNLAPPHPLDIPPCLRRAAP